MRLNLPCQTRAEEKDQKHRTGSGQWQKS